MTIVPFPRRDLPHRPYRDDPEVIVPFAGSRVGPRESDHFRKVDHLLTSLRYQIAALANLSTSAGREDVSLYSKAVLAHAREIETKLQREIDRHAHSPTKLS